MKYANEWRSAKVASIATIASDVRHVEFLVDGNVPKFDAGSHTNIEVVIDGDIAIRSYTCIEAKPGHIAIAVKLHPQSRGGSSYIWSLEVGDEAKVTLPENRFQLSWNAPEYVLLAGGIGVTPIFGMAQSLRERGAVVSAHYGAANVGMMAFKDELEASLGDDLHLYSAEEGEMPDLPAIIAKMHAEGELYVCGPLPMLQAVKRAWEESGRPVSRLRFEVFGDSGAFTEELFTIKVLNHDVEVKVAPNESMLSALQDAGVEMIYDCQRGECGLCKVGIVDSENEIDHRDVFFSNEEKESGTEMCACVSRFVGGNATIDIGYRSDAQMPEKNASQERTAV